MHTAVAVIKSEKVSGVITFSQVGISINNNRVCILKDLPLFRIITEYTGYQFYTVMLISSITMLETLD